MVADRAIVTAGETADALTEIAAEAIEVGVIAVDEVVDGTIDGRFATNSGPRLGPKSAVRRKPTIILRSWKRPRKSSKWIASIRT